MSRELKVYFVDGKKSSKTYFVREDFIVETPVRNSWTFVDVHGRSRMFRWDRINCVVLSRGEEVKRDTGFYCRSCGNEV